MHFLKKKSDKIRNNFVKFELKKNIYKYVFIYSMNKSFEKSYKYSFSKLCSRFRISKSKIKTRCILTNRGKSIYKKYNLSRIALRQMVQFGVLPGYTKAAW